MRRGDVWLTLAGPLLWAAWFVIAYGLHGSACTQLPAVANESYGLHQWLQAGVWLLALVSSLIVLRRAQTRARQLGHADGQHRVGVVVRLGAWIGLLAIVFNGLPVVFIAPC